MMLEPDVTYTDFALAAECLVFSFLLGTRRSDERTIPRLFAMLFAALGASSFLGGIWHGVFSGEGPLAGRWLWFATMGALAVAAALLWHVSAALLPDRIWAAWIRRLAWGQLAAQIFVSGFVTDAFLAGAGGMLPPVLLLLSLYLRRWRTDGTRRAVAGAAGLALAAGSALVIAFDLSLHPHWMTANAVYHLLQLVAFWLVFISVPAVTAQAR